MPITQIPIIKGDKIGVETDYRDALPVNMYAVARDILGSKGYILNYSGLTELTTGVGKDRGANYNDRFLDQYRVSGQSLISVSNSGVTAVLGTISGEEQVAMAHSFNTQCVIADGNMYLYSPSLGFSEVADLDLGDPIDVVWVDGYYFLTDGEYIYHTDISDESSIDPLKFATAEFMPDKSLGLGKTQDNKVLVFGRYTLEYFVNVSTSNFAFQRIETRAQKIGIVATHAKCEVDGAWFITGGRKEESIGIHAIGVGSSEKLSTREIDKILSKYTELQLADMRMEGRKENNISFVIIHLPFETLCLNLTIAKVFGTDYAWSILKTDIDESTPYRGINGVFDARSAKWVYGDRQDSTIGYLDDTTPTHYGEKVEFIFYTPFINLEGFSIDRLELETIPGYTDTDDAKIAFSITNNGATYSTESWELYGEPKEYGQRFIVRSLGYVGDWIGFKFRGACTSKMAFSMMGVTYS